MIGRVCRTTLSISFCPSSLLLCSLQSRQKQWAKAEEERIRNTPDPDMPPGHRKMPEEERLRTLEILKESKHS